jgi:hypothetical protein
MKYRSAVLAPLIIAYSFLFLTVNDDFIQYKKIAGVICRLEQLDHTTRILRQIWDSGPKWDDWASQETSLFSPDTL